MVKSRCLFQLSADRHIMPSTPNISLVTVTSHLCNTHDAHSTMPLVHNCCSMQPAQSAGLCAHGTSQTALLLQLVGPILVQDAKPMSQDLQQFLDQGVSKGQYAVYASMGTLARLPEAELRSMAAAFSALSNLVLWKLDAKDMPRGFAFIMSDCLAALSCALQCWGTLLCGLCVHAFFHMLCMLSFLSRTVCAEALLCLIPYSLQQAYDAAECFA